MIMLGIVVGIGAKILVLAFMTVDSKREVVMCNIWFIIYVNIKLKSIFYEFIIIILKTSWNESYICIFVIIHQW